MPATKLSDKDQAYIKKIEEAWGVERRSRSAKLSVEDALSDRQDAYPTVMRCLIGKIRGFALSRKSCSWRDAEPNRAPECKILELQASEN